MKTQLKLVAFAVFSMFNFRPATCFSQGSLTPPGAPAPLFKTLDQIKAGTPVTNLPYTITNPGLYFLTTSMTNSGTAISILSDDVVLDFGGFSLTGDGPTGSDVGVAVGSDSGSGQKRVTIRNGTIRSYFRGVQILSPSSLCVVEDMLLENCGLGVVFSTTATNTATQCILRRCRLESNTIRGLVVGTLPDAPPQRHIIQDCIARNNGQIGFQVGGSGNLIIRNIATGTGNSTNDYSISFGNLVGAVVTVATNAGTITTSSAGTGTTDPFANLRY